MLGLLCGLRLAELVGLRVERIDLAGRRLLVSRGKGDKDRYVPIGRRLLPELATHLAGRTTGWLFPSPMPCRTDRHLSTRAVGLVVAGCATRAGIVRPPGETVHPHTLRHSMACRLLETGATIWEVKEILGHASLATTSVYLHVVSAQLLTAVDRL